jgi:hypothetical protein
MLTKRLLLSLLLITLVACGAREDKATTLEGSIGKVLTLTSSSFTESEVRFIERACGALSGKVARLLGSSTVYNYKFNIKRRSCGFKPTVGQPFDVLEAAELNLIRGANSEYQFIPATSNTANHYFTQFESGTYGDLSILCAEAAQDIHKVIYSSISSSLAYKIRIDSSNCLTGEDRAVSSNTTCVWVESAIKNSGSGMYKIFRSTSYLINTEDSTNHLGIIKSKSVAEECTSADLDPSYTNSSLTSLN